MASFFRGKWVIMGFGGSFLKINLEKGKRILYLRFMKGKEKLKSVKISESVHESLKNQAIYEKTTVTKIADRILSHNLENIKLVRKN